MRAATFMAEEPNQAVTDLAEERSSTSRVALEPVISADSFGRRKERDGEVHEKSLEMRHFRVFPYPESPPLPGPPSLWVWKG